MTDPTQRLTGGVENYIPFRSGYPPGLLDLLRREGALTERSVVADVRFGTGILARLLLEGGNRVIMVGPNDEIRHVGRSTISSCRAPSTQGLLVSLREYP